MQQLVFKSPCDLLQLFCDDKRGEVKVANPEAGFAELAKLLAAAWKECDAATKARYQEQSQVGNTAPCPCLLLQDCGQLCRQPIQQQCNYRVPTFRGTPIPTGCICRSTVIAHSNLVLH